MSDLTTEFKALSDRLFSIDEIDEMMMLPMVIVTPMDGSEYWLSADDLFEMFDAVAPDLSPFNGTAPWAHLLNLVSKGSIVTESHSSL